MKESKKTKHQKTPQSPETQTPFIRTLRAVCLGETELKPIVNYAILCVAALLCLAPFWTKNFHIDDPLFIWAAHHIQEEPSNPYNFSVNWVGHPEPMYQITKNPPGACYYIAGAASLFGFSEPALHIAFFLPALGVVLGTYLIGAWYCKRRTLAALLALCTPVFLVSSTSVMSDVLMLFFWVFAVYFWLRATEKNSHIDYFIASLLIPLCLLSKYFGMMILPVLALYSIVKTRRIGLWALHFIIPLAVMYWYQTWTQQLYGAGLLTDAASFATNVPTTFSKFSIAKFGVGFAFTGGCVITVLFFTRRLYSWVELLIGAALSFVIMLIVSQSKSLDLFLLPSNGSERSFIGFQFGFYVMSGLSLCILSVREFLRDKSSESLLLTTWVIGTFIFATFVNWTTNGRSILPMVPAAALLIVRRIEQGPQSKSSLSLSQILLPLGASALLSFMVARGDANAANAAGTAAAKLHEKYQGRTMSFQGHWGFQYYFEGFGHRSFNGRAFNYVHGDLLVLPLGNSGITYLPEDKTRFIEKFEMPVRTIASTMNQRGAAGFYADSFGPLPFTFSRMMPEIYNVYEMQ